MYSNQQQRQPVVPYNHQDHYSRHSNYDSYDSYDYYDDSTFWDAIPAAFTYPFRKDGLYLFIGAIVFFTALEFLKGIPMVGLVVGIFSAGYMISYMFRVISSTADGSDELPDWPEFTNFWDDILLPLFQWTVLMFMCGVPPFVLLAMGKPVIALVVGLLALCYLPMALMAVSLTGSIFAANPITVFRSVAEIPFQYILTTLSLGAIIGGSWAIQFAVASAGGALIGGMVAFVVSLYFLLVQMRLLGELYYYNAEKLNWFGEADRRYIPMR